MSHSYEEDLWGNIKAVYDRYEEGKKIMKEMMEFLKEKISAEDEYSKKLAKISKQIPLRENGTLPSCWGSVKLQVEGVGKQHSAMASQLTQNLLNGLTNFKKEQSKAKEHLESEMNKLSKDLEKSKATLMKAKTKHFQTCKERDAASANSEKDVPPKEAAKWKNKHSQLAKQAESTDAAYQTAVQEHQQMQKRYEEEVKKILKEFQKLEEARGEYLSKMMESYLFTQEALIGGYQQSVLGLKGRCEQIDFKSDMEKFLSEKTTGLSPSPLVEYEPYDGSMTTPKPDRKKTASSANLLQKENSKANIVEETHTLTKENSTPVLTRPETTKKKEPTKARAVFEYIPEEDNELGFKQGDIITVSKMDESGWWEGSCNGNEGMFPGNFVELLDEKKEIDKSEAKKCVAKFDFTAETDDELTIREGDVITIISEAEGWILGASHSSGGQGLFPANYAEKIS